MGLPPGFRKSVRDGSFFARSHLTIRQIVIMVYCWSCDMPQQQMAREAGVLDLGAIVDWCNFMREDAEKWLDSHSTQIGGMDVNGDPIVVEIDETKYFHRKYHRGQWRDGHWVFGGVERESGKCFLVTVPNRNAATLQALILKHILPGSHIMSDGWAAYAGIPALGGGIYEHSVVVHQHNFVDPMDCDVHTQSVENMWMRAKRKLKRQFGTSRALFESYLHEFAYRNFFTGKDLFNAFIVTLSDNYA
jgi:transposase-like protein